VEERMAGYNIVYTGGCGEITEKKSRFIANVFPVKNEAEAAKFIEGTKKKYWDARHNCYAYVLDGGISKCSDDGEPQGTAGRPILEVINGAMVCDVLIIVTRYFGGTLLGTGGLVRAYSGAAKEGLSSSIIVKKQSGKKLFIKTDYNGAGKLQYIAAQMGITVNNTEYGTDVQMELCVPSGDVQAFIKKVTEATSGQAGIDMAEDIYFAYVDGETVLL